MSPDGVADDSDQSVEVRQPSTAWIYREVVPTGTWTPEEQGVIDAADVADRGTVDMTAPNRFGALYFANNHPLATGRGASRFAAARPPGYLGGLPGGPALRRGADDRPVLEPAGALGDLVGDGAVAAVPGDRPAGGAYVRRSGGEHADLLADRVVGVAALLHAVDEYMGWQSQLGLFPNSLQFEVVEEGVGCRVRRPSRRSGGARSLASG